MAEKVTSLEVAALAGVSQSAVSRVFTPGSSVSKKTADKVLAAAAQLGYRPNVLARAMSSSPTSKTTSTPRWSNACRSNCKRSATTS